MINELKSLYGQAFISNPADINEPDAFYWFKTKTGIPFGIRKSAVTENEYQLLTFSFHPVNLPPKLLSDEERKWNACLFEGDCHGIPLTNDIPRYFLHIFFKNPFKEMDSFREAIFALFDEEPIILWKNAHTAVIILKHRPDTAKTEEIAQLLASDFYTNVSLFIGAALNDPMLAKAGYDLEELAFDLARKCFPEKHSYVYEKVTPLLLLSEIPDNLLNDIFSSLKTTIGNEDSELMTSLLAYFEHGMNITAASKALFIHRNSLQYRIDKFNEKTGLDPKQFEDAIFIYLALLAQKLT